MNTPSVLGETRIRVPIAGRIRPGLKILTKKASEDPRAKALYEEGLEKGESFEAMAKKIAEKTGIQNALVPKNTPFFAVHRHDFVVPETADRILELYGEDRGDGERRLYRFPVVFVMDHWLSVIPHGFRCFTASELKYWSEYAPDGRRFCMTHGAVPVDPKAKRAKRLFGGRPVETRKNNGGLCDPNSCPEYQARQCNLSGEFLFFMPGIPGAGMISLPTNSFYAMLYAREKLEMVAAMRGGRIAGLLDGKPIFWITKRIREISMIDPETGLPRKVNQWLIELESTLDAVSLMRPGDPDEAASLLAGDSRPALPHPESAAPQEAALGEAPAAEDGKAEPARKPEDEAPAEEPRAEAIRDKRKLVHEMIKRAGLEIQKFKAYAERAWGPGWSVSVDTLDLAIETLDPLVDDPEARARWAAEHLEKAA